MTKVETDLHIVRQNLQQSRWLVRYSIIN